MAPFRFQCLYRGIRKKGETDDDIPAVISNEMSFKESRQNWARLIQKIYEVDPLATGRLFRALARNGYFIVLYAMGFNIVAAWTFWSEFGVRFNFISIDYLVYRREVTHNILESYPVFVILPILLVITIVMFRALRPARQRGRPDEDPMRKESDHQETFGPR